jgi:hypothetical protein
MRRALSLVFLGMMAGHAWAAVGSAETSGSALSIARGARPAAMGDAYVAVASGADSILWNAAGMDQLRDLQATAGHLAYLDGITDDYLEIARPIYGFGAWGVGTNYLYTSDQGYDNWGNQTGTFSDYDFAAEVAVSAELTEDLHIGGVYKIIDEDYARQHSQGSAFDFGLQWRNIWQFMDLGLVGANLGTPIALGSYFSPLPATLKAGSAFHLTQDWLLAIDYEYQPVDFFNKWHFGTEYGFNVAGAQTFARLGYSFAPEDDDGGNTGLTAGLGVALGSWQVDYAFVPQGDLGNTQRLSLTWSSWLF